MHIGALIWEPILISLAVTIQLSSLDKSLEVVAAGLMLDAKDTINWLWGVNDEFEEKSRLPLVLGVLSSLASLGGVFIILVGVLQAIF